MDLVRVPLAQLGLLDSFIHLISINLRYAHIRTRPSEIDLYPPGGWVMAGGRGF
jgi:hypothetical protein